MDTLPEVTPQLIVGKDLTVKKLAAFALQSPAFPPEEDIVVPDYEIVEAPVGELCVTGESQKFPKSNAAIGSHPVKGNYSMMMRKLFNVLLYLSWTRVRKMSSAEVTDVYVQRKVMRFESSGAEIKKLIGWEHSGDYTGLYQTLDALQRLQLKWDVMAADGKEWTKSSSLISQWERREDNGKVAWSWMPDLFEVLFDPNRPYTPMDLALLRSFSSKYTLALYENCFRWRKVGATPWRDAREWVLLIAGPDLYKGFGEFNRTALKTAINEIKNNQDCPITVEVDEKHGRYNRVEQLRFKVHLKKQAPLGLDLPPDIEPEFPNQLKSLGVAETKVRQLFRDYDIYYLVAQLKEANKEIAKGKVDNPAGYFIWRVEHLHKEHLEIAEVLTQKVLLERKALDSLSAKQASQDAVKQASLDWLYKQSPEFQENLFQEFIVGSPFSVSRACQRSGRGHKMVQISWMIWLAARPELAHILAESGPALTGIA